MKNTYRVAMVMVTALSAVLLLAPAPGRGQAPSSVTAEEKDKALRAKRLAEQFEDQARVLTIFDREGEVVTTVGERAIYNHFVVSPDRTRLAVIKWDLESDTENLWVLDVATGKSIPITASNQTRSRQQTRWPVWSPDGSQLAYVALRGGYWGLYRKASSGARTEELLYQHPGGGLVLSDWSLDGRFLAFSESDLGGGTLYVLPLAADGQREPIVVLRSEFQLREPRFSPDSRFLSYASNQSGEFEIHVRPFDPSAPGAVPAEGPWQVSDQGARSAAAWRGDGKEMYYFAPGFAHGELMVVEVSPAPTFQAGKPKLLLRIPHTGLGARIASQGIGRDGERIVIAVPPAPTLRQITVFDRQGNVLSKIGEPGRYFDPAVSPDGTKVAVGRLDPMDIWVFDLATGKGTPVTEDDFPENAPTWSPDGRQVAYVSSRGEAFSIRSIYRKSADGTGNAEQLFQYEQGVSLWPTDWSADGKFMTFHDGNTGLLYVLPLDQAQEALDREAMDWLRDEYNVAQARLSPNARFMAYLSNEGKTTEEINNRIWEVYVRPFDPAKSDVSSGGDKPVQISTAGALGGISWRQDSKEMYYLTPDLEVMAVDIFATTPTFQAARPRLLFKLPGRLIGQLPFVSKNVSADGQRFVFAIAVPASIYAR